MNETYDHRIDIWSIGVLTFELCTGSPPFEASTSHATYQRITTLDLQMPSHLSPECCDFIE